MKRLLVPLLLLTACNVGPEYKRPEMPKAAPGAFKENTPGSEDAQAGGWRQAKPSDEALRGKWWEMFGEPELNALEERVIVDNQNIKQSFESYMAARASVRAAQAQLYPQVSVGPGVSVTNGDATFDLPLTVQWEPDLFSKLRNGILQQANIAQQSAATLANTRLSEQVSLAAYYFQIRGQDALLDLYDHTLENYRESLRITKTLARTGIDSQQDVAQAETTLRSAEANASAIASQRALYEHAIALLVGESAGNFAMAKKNLEVKLPEVPIGVPSQLLERRPDIAAAERSMAAANALIGVGKAAYYPDISINGGVGTRASEVGKLFSSGTNYWTAGGTVSEKVLDFGLRKATVQQYEAQYRATVAGYRQTVLGAFKEVEDYLVQLRQLAEQSERLKRATDASTQYVQLATTRYKTGIDTYLNLVTAQTSLLSNQSNLVTAQTNQMVASVHLIAALGGGWTTKELPAVSDTKKDP